MTPKEKAQELLSKYTSITLKEVVPDIFLAFDEELCKKFALIAIDELIEATSIKYEYNSDFEIKITGKKPLQYWLDVKTEMESL